MDKYQVIAEIGKGMSGAVAGRITWHVGLGSECLQRGAAVPLSSSVRACCRVHGPRLASHAGYWRYNGIAVGLLAPGSARAGILDSRSGAS